MVGAGFHQLCYLRLAGRISDVGDAEYRCHELDSSTNQMDRGKHKKCDLTAECWVGYPFILYPAGFRS